MILELIYAVLIGVGTYCIIEYLSHLSKLSRFPSGPFPLPVIGNLHQLGRKPHESLMELSKRYGDVFSLSFGNQRVVVVNGIKSAIEMLLKRGEDLSGRPQDLYTAAIISRNFQDIGFHDSGSDLKLMRKIAHSALKFYGSGLENLESNILLEIDEMCQRCSMQLGVPMDLYDDIALVVTNIICSLIIGTRYKLQDPEFLDIVRHGRLIARGLDFASAVAFIPWLKYFPNNGISSIKEGVAIRDAFVSRKLKEHQESFDPNNLRDFTDALISEFSKEVSTGEKNLCKLTDTNLEMILADLFLAGTETTVTTLYWSLAYLVTWPEVQEKIIDEQKCVLGERQPVLKDRRSLPFFEAVIQEVLRFSSILPLGVPRKTTRNTLIDGKAIPGGTQVILNLWAIHHDEREWKSPELFEPERWLDKDGSFIHGLTKMTLPFGAGKRVCIGESLAKIEIFLFLSNLLYRYKVKPVFGRLPDLAGVLSVTYSPKSFQVILERRDDGSYYRKDITS